ncbi:UNVERIFIED_CONTAM: hypothetical protein GTU68_045637, partial [Idotea baltica]|nr:hypothetical protein [Idotea baltica]
MKIAILSRKRSLYSTRRLMEAGREKGHNMMVIDHLHCNLVLEQKKPEIIYHGFNLNNLDAIIPRIGSSVTYYGAAVIRQFEMRNVFTTLTSSALLQSRDKLSSLQLLARAGLDMPKTVFTNSTQDKDEVIASVGGPPLIIKLLEGTQGIGVVLTDTKSAAKSVMEAFNDLKAKVIIQEYIKESKGEDVRALVVNGRVVGAMLRKAKAGEFRSNLHRGGSAEITKLEPTEAKAAILACKTLGLSVAGVDILR